MAPIARTYSGFFANAAPVKAPCWIETTFAGPNLSDAPLEKRLRTLKERTGGHTKGLSELERDDGSTRPNMPRQNTAKLGFNGAIGEASDASYGLVPLIAPHPAYAATHERAPTPDECKRAKETQARRQEGKVAPGKWGRAGSGNGIELLRKRACRGSQSGPM